MSWRSQADEAYEQGGIDAVADLFESVPEGHGRVECTNWRCGQRAVIRIPDDPSREVACRCCGWRLAGYSD